MLVPLPAAAGARKGIVYLVKFAQIGLKKFVRMVIANCLNFC